MMTRSIRIHEFGGPEVLRIEEETVPLPGEGQVRLRVRAIGLNRTEVTFRSGRSPAKVAMPSRIGVEGAGEIDAVGPGVVGFKAGDRVAVIPSFGPGEVGLYAEMAIVPVRALVLVPDDVDWSDAAATWMSFATAWAGLIEIGSLTAGQTILISAASSSAGLAAIQVARKVGAVPVALTRGSGKAAALLESGAAHVIATGEQDVVAEVARITDGRGADLVFDPVAGPGFASLIEATSAGGTLIVYGVLDAEATPLPAMRLLMQNLTIRGFGLPSVSRIDSKLAALKGFISEGLASGELKPTIAKTFAFDQIIEAHRYLEAGTQVGKIVVLT